MASLSTAQRMDLLNAKSQETKAKLASTRGMQQPREIDEDEVNRALEEEAQWEELAWQSQQQRQAMFSHCTHG